MFGWEFPPHISGGLGTACYGMTKALVEAGLEVIFVLPRIGSAERKSHVTLLSASEIGLSQGVSGPGEWAGLSEVRSIDSLLGPYLTERRYDELRRQWKIAAPGTRTQKKGVLEISGNYGPDLFQEVTRYGEIAGAIAKEERFDVIHVHDWMTVPAGVKAKSTAAKPLVYHAHALEFDRSGENVNQKIYDMERYGMEKADFIIAVSHYTKNMITRRYGIRPDKIDVVHNAVSPRDSKVDVPEKRRKEKIVLFLGRITHQKGPDYFVEAASRVLHEMPDVMFVMAGSGDMLHQMILKVAQLGIGRQFHFTGFLRQADVERIFAMSDLYVMPSVSEPFGISPLEAIQSGVPVIISKQSGVAEVLRTAMKVDFWDVQTLADKMIAILKYPALRRTMKEGHREELKTIHWKNAAQKIIRIYEKLVSGGTVFGVSTKEVPIRAC
jgi:glycosyltransferase involved in cell wall biosynthesis